MAKPRYFKNSVQANYNIYVGEVRRSLRNDFKWHRHSSTVWNRSNLIELFGKGLKPKQAAEIINTNQYKPKKIIA